MFKLRPPPPKKGKKIELNFILFPNWKQGCFCNECRKTNFGKQMDLLSLPEKETQKGKMKNKKVQKCKRCENVKM